MIKEVFPIPADPQTIMFSYLFLDSLDVTLLITSFIYPSISLLIYNLYHSDSEKECLSMLNQVFLDDLCYLQAIKMDDFVGESVRSPHHTLPRDALGE